MSEEQSSEINTESSTSSFLDALPEDLRGNESLKDFKDVAGLAKSYVSAKSMLGSSIRIPGEDASDEARQEFYEKLQSIPGVTRLPDMDNPEAMADLFNKLGRPESPDKYNVELPEELGINSEMYSEFAKIAYEAGLTQEQVNKVMGFEVGRLKAEAEHMTEQREAAVAALKQAWGADYDNRLAGAKEAVKAYREKYPEFVDELVNGPAGNNPALLAMLSELGRSFQEQGLIGKGTVNYGVSPDEANEKINEIMSNRAHAYHNPDDPGHDAAVDKMRKLYNAAYPDS